MAPSQVAVAVEVVVVVGAAFASCGDLAPARSLESTLSILLINKILMKESKLLKSLFSWS